MFYSKAQNGRLTQIGSMRAHPDLGMAISWQANRKIIVNVDEKGGEVVVRAHDEFDDACSYMMHCILYVIWRIEHAHIHSYIHTYIHTHIHTSMHACIHTYIHTYTHTYIHAYAHAYI